MAVNGTLSYALNEIGYSVGAATLFTFLSCGIFIVSKNFKTSSSGRLVRNAAGEPVEFESRSGKKTKKSKKVGDQDQKKKTGVKKMTKKELIRTIVGSKKETTNNSETVDIESKDKKATKPEPTLLAKATKKTMKPQTAPCDVTLPVSHVTKDVSVSPVALDCAPVIAKVCQQNATQSTADPPRKLGRRSKKTIKRKLKLMQEYKKAEENAKYAQNIKDAEIDRVKDLTTTNTQLERQCTMIQKEMTQHQARQRLIEMSRDEAEKRVNEMEGRIQSLQECFDDLEREEREALDASSLKLALNSTDDVTQLRQNLTELEEKLQQARHLQTLKDSQIKELSDALCDSEMEKDAEEKRVIKLALQIQDLEENTTLLNCLIESNKLESDRRLADEQEQAQATIDDLMSQLKDAQERCKTNNKLKTQITVMEKQLSEYQERLDWISVSLSQAEENYRIQTANVKSLTVENSKLSAAHTTLQTQHDNMITTFTKNRQTLLDEKKTELRAKDIEIETLRQQLAQKEAEMSGLKICGHPIGSVSDRDALEAELCETEADLVLANHKCEQLHQQLEAQREEFETELAQKKLTLENTEEVLASLQQSVEEEEDHWRSQLTYSEKEMENLRQELYSYHSLASTPEEVVTDLNFAYNCVEKSLPVIVDQLASRLQTVEEECDELRRERDLSNRIIEELRGDLAHSLSLKALSDAGFQSSFLELKPTRLSIGNESYGLDSSDEELDTLDKTVILARQHLSDAVFQSPPVKGSYGR